MNLETTGNTNASPTQPLASPARFLPIEEAFDISPSSEAIEPAVFRQNVSQPQNIKLPIHTGGTNVFDVAAYILEKCGEMSALKLQKLVYYCQAWSLVWDEAPLFPERIEAWAYGPVVKELYEYHRGFYRLSRLPLGASFKLTSKQKQTIDAVINYYSVKTPQQLIELTHLEDPWKNARQGLPVGAPSNREITHEAMAEYYSSL